MLQGRRCCLWRSLAFVAATCLIACVTAHARDSSASVKEAEQYIAGGNLKAAVIELKNAVSGSPEDPAMRVQLAQVYFQLQDFASAEHEALAARELNGNEADYLPILADALLGQRKFKDVLDLIEPGDRHPVLEAKIRTARGIAAAGLGDGEQSKEMLRDAIRLDPSAMKPRILLAELLNGTDPKAADQVIDEAIAANPNAAEPVQVQGEMLWSRGDADRAMQVFDEVLKIDPENLRARLSRANVNIARDQFAAADEDLDPILRAAPDNFMANYLRGWEQVKRQQYIAADRTFDRLRSAFPSFPVGYYFQGMMKLVLGQFAPAENILGKYLANVPGDLRGRRLIAIAALRQHAAPRAIGYLKPMADASRADPATLSLLGYAYMTDGKPALALQQFEKAAALDPENVTIKTDVAISNIDAGQGQQGLAQLEQLFTGKAAATIAGPTLVLTELRAGRVDKAAEVAASLIKRDANNPLYQKLLGSVRVEQQDHAAAETAFRAALAIDPEFSEAARDLAQLYLATGRTGDAKKVYNDLLSRKKDDHDLLSRKKDDVTALLGLADIAIAEQKWPEAANTINRARTVAPLNPAPGLKLISLYELRRDWISAMEVAADLTTRFPRDVNLVEVHARTQLEAGDTEGAISSYKLAHELAPDTLPILSRYAALLNQAKYFREARDVLQDAVARYPSSTSLKSDLIRAEGEIDGVDAALIEARSFAKDDPGNSLYDLVSAELLEKAGRTGEAVALLETALAARPSEDDLTVALSRLYNRTGDFAKAETVLTRRLTKAPRNVAIDSALAPLDMTTGRPNEAKKVYSDILSQRPNDVATLIALAQIAIAEQKWPEATDYVMRARSAAPNDPAPGLTLVNMYALRRDWVNADATSADLAVKFPANIDVLDARARVQTGAGDTEGAGSTYKRAHELAPDSLPILSRYLAALDAAKNFREAQTVLQAALVRDPQNASLKAEMIRVEAEIGGLDAGLAKARMFTENAPDNGLYDVVSAELYEKAGRAGEAIALLEKAVAARPSDGGLTTALSHLYTVVGEPAKAEEVLSARLKADPKDFAVRSALALFYLEQRKYDAATAEYRRIIAEHPPDPTALNNLAWLYRQQGDLAGARQLAERAFAAAPRAAPVDDTLGWILVAQGAADEAISYLSAANLSAPRDPDIQYHLAVALQRVGRAADAQAILESLLGSGISFMDKPEAEKLLQELRRG
jgi:putative PEP-CTERM system TPR-repeat lipoprotein